MTGLPDLEWDELRMSEAYLWARKSKDPRTQVGAVIVAPNNDDRTRGYNGPLRGLDDADPILYRKPDGGGPSPYMQHAERNAITNAARIGVSTLGCTMYVTLYPCHECAGAIVNAGIREIVLHEQAPGPTTSSQGIAMDILRRAGIAVRYWSGTPLISEVRFDGSVIDTGRDHHI